MKEGTPNAELEAGTAYWLWLALSVSVGLLFVYAGAIKAWDPIGFASDIENFHILPWTVGVRLAFYLPWLELSCGLALIARRFDEGAIAILSGLMIVFIAASVIAKARGIDVSCGCFGHATKSLPFAMHLLIDFALLVALGALWLRRRRSGS